MTKQEFAIKLLFWLMPWPLSKPLARILHEIIRDRIPDFPPLPEPSPYEPPFPPIYPPGPGPGQPGPIHVPQKPRPRAQWVSHFDDDDWWNPDQNNNITWHTDRWKIFNWAGDTDGVLSPKPASTWATDYRPTQIRVTMDVTSITDLSEGAIWMYHAGPVIVFSQDTYTSLEEISFTLTSDILGLNFSEAPSSRHVYILNIEFLET